MAVTRPHPAPMLRRGQRGISRALLITRVGWHALRAPRDHRVGWERYWRGVRRTGVGGDVLWDSGDLDEVPTYLALMRAHLDCEWSNYLAVATIGILQQRTARETTELNGQLQYALSSRVVIEQAKGILAHYGRLDMDEAFTALRGHARTHRLPLTDLAQALVNRQQQPADILRIPAPAHPTTSRPQPPPALRG